ncbi:MAG: hypothetical protein IJP35_06925 [Clostridia bacterium]|nr:hypothetical protein [Clostridia bacterium]
MKTFDIKEWSPKKRAVLIVLALLLILCIITSATYAWLRDNSGILTNTFTGSNLTINLTETAKTYKMVPNTPIAKDPTVTVEATSEPAYVFLKAIESDAFSNYADYYIDNTWQPYGGFVVDGELDSFYRKTDGWYFNSTDASYGLEAYYSNSDKHNGDATALYKNATFAQTYQPLAEAINSVDANRCQIALEMYVAYDPNYVYVYAKVFDNDYYQGAKYTDSNHSDYFGIYCDPDPLSYTNTDQDDYEAHFDTFYPTNNELVSNPSSLSYQKLITTQGEMEVKFYPARATTPPSVDEVSPIPSAKKIGFGNGTITNFYHNGHNYFTNQGIYADAQGKNYVMVDMYKDMNGQEVLVNGQPIKTGYIVETRLPRNDNYFTNPNGNPVFAMNVAATNFASDYNNDQMSISFSKLWWLKYENMITFELDDKNSPFAAANTGVYYKIVGSEQDGPLANDVTIPVLRSGYVFGEQYNNGYVWVRDDVTTEMLNNLTNTPVTLQFKACAIQQAHLTLEQAYQEAIGNLS